MVKRNPNERSALRDIAVSGKDRNQRTGELTPPHIVGEKDPDSFEGMKTSTFRDNLEKVCASVAQESKSKWFYAFYLFILTISLNNRQFQARWSI